METTSEQNLNDKQFNTQQNLMTEDQEDRLDSVRVVYINSKPSIDNVQSQKNVQIDISKVKKLANADDIEKSISTDRDKTNQMKSPILSQKRHMTYFGEGGDGGGPGNQITNKSMTHLDSSKVKRGKNDQKKSKKTVKIGHFNKDVKEQSNVIQNQMNMDLTVSKEFDNPDQLNESIVINENQKQLESKVREEAKQNLDDVLHQIQIKVKKWNIVKKFVANLKDLSNIREEYKLKQFHYDIISDKCFIQKIENADQKLKAILYLSDKFKQILHSISEQTSKIGVFNPQQNVVIFWKCLLFVSCVIELFKLPLKASFNLIFEVGLEYYLLTLLPLSQFLTEIIFNFNTGYYEDGQIVTDRNKIFRNYIRHMFVIDLINAATIAFVQYFPIQALYFFFWFRVIQLSFSYKIIDDHFQITQLFPTFSTVIKLVTQMLFTCHFLGCLFHTVAFTEEAYGNQDTWLYKYGINDAEWSVKYLYSFYFQLITMCTVGYGDISPQSNTEKLFCIVSTLLSCGVFAYAINTIGQIFQDILKKQENYIQQKFIISKYMLDREVDEKLKRKVLKYLEYIQVKEKEDPKNGNQILDNISKNLKEEVLKGYYGKILREKNSPFITGKFTDKCLDVLSLYMHETLYGPGEVIFKQGESDKKLFYIVKGEVELFIDTPDDAENIMLATFQAKSFIGQIGFLSGKPRDLASRSKNISLIVYIDLDDFVKVLKQFPQDYEKYCQLRDEILIYNDMGKAKCFSCDKEGHFLLTCPMLHLQIKKSVFLTCSNYNFPQKFRNQEYIRTRQTLRKQNLNTVKLVPYARVQLRKIRERLIAQALDEEPPHSSDYENDIEDEDDQEFFLRCEKIEYENGKIKVLEQFSDDDSFQYVKHQQQDDTDSNSQNSQDNDEIDEDEDENDDDQNDQDDIQKEVQKMNKHKNILFDNIGIPSYDRKKTENNNINFGVQQNSSNKSRDNREQDSFSSDDNKSPKQSSSRKISNPKKQQQTNFVQDLQQIPNINSQFPQGQQQNEQQQQFKNNNQEIPTNSQQLQQINDENINQLKPQQNQYSFQLSSHISLQNIQQIKEEEDSEGSGSSSKSSQSINKDKQNKQELVKHLSGKSNKSSKSSKSSESSESSKQKSSISEKNKQTIKQTSEEQNNNNIPESIIIESETNNNSNSNNNFNNFMNSNNNNIKNNNNINNNNNHETTLKTSINQTIEFNETLIKNDQGDKNIFIGTEDTDELNMLIDITESLKFDIGTKPFQIDSSFIFKDDDDFDIKYIIQPVAPDRKKLKNLYIDKKRRQEREKQNQEKLQLQNLINNNNNTMANTLQNKQIILSPDNEENPEKQKQVTFLDTKLPQERNSASNSTSNNILSSPLKQSSQQQSQQQMPSKLRRGSVKPVEPFKSGPKQRRQSTKFDQLSGMGQFAPQVSKQGGRKMSIMPGSMRKMSILGGGGPQIGMGQKQEGRRQSIQMQQINPLQMPGFASQNGGLVKNRQDQVKLKRLGNKQRKKSQAQSLEIDILSAQLQIEKQKLFQLFPQLKDDQKNKMTKRHGVDQELLQKQLETKNMPQKELFIYDMEGIKNFLNYFPSQNHEQIIESFNRIQRQIKMENRKKKEREQREKEQIRKSSKNTEINKTIIQPQRTSGSQKQNQ